MTQALKDIIINALEEVKATEITTIDVRDLTGITDTMVVASGNSNRQVKALANSVVVDAKAAGHEMSGMDSGGFWRCYCSYHAACYPRVL